MPVSLLFFTTLDLIWPKFCPKTTPILGILAGFQWNVLGDSININNFNCNPVILKIFLLKPLKIAIFGDNLRKKKGSLWATPKPNRIFLYKWQKQIVSFLKLFILSKYHMFWLSYVFLFCGNVFLLKRVISSHNSC